MEIISHVPYRNHGDALTAESLVGFTGELVKKPMWPHFLDEACYPLSWTKNNNEACKLFFR